MADGGPYAAVVGLAGEAPAQERRERQQRGDLRAQRAARGHDVGEAGRVRVAPAGLAVREVASHAPAVAGAEPAAVGGADDRLDARAPSARRELLVLLGESLAGPEERRLDRRPAHRHALADLAVREALELAHDEDLVVGVGQAAQRAAQVVELLLVVEGDVGGGFAGDEAAVVGGAEALLGVVGDLFGAPLAPELVDARVLRDLVDPRLERDRPVGVAHAPQGRDEDVLGQVLSPGMVLDHPEDVRGDPARVAAVELLEGAVIPAADRGDKIGVGLKSCGPRVGRP